MKKMDILVGGTRHELAIADGQDHLMRETKALVEQEARAQRAHNPGAPDSQVMLLTTIAMADQVLACRAELRAEQNRVRALEIALRSLREARAESSRASGGEPRGGV